MDGKRGVSDAGAEAARGATKAGERTDDRAEQGEHVVGTPVRQLGFRARPDPFVGIELRRVGREIGQAESWVLLEAGSHDRPAVNGAVVPDDDDGTSQMTQQGAQEVTRVRCPEILAMQLEIEPAAPPRRTEREPRDDRHAIMCLPVAQDRRLAARRPGAAHGGDQEEARFVDEDEVGPQPRGVFFTRGHSRAFHWVIAASSRCSARRSGFCGVQPR